MSESKEICIYIFGHNNGFCENLFENAKRKKNEEEIIQKEYGNIIKNKIKYKMNTDDWKFFLPFLKKELHFQFIVYKYPYLNEQNVRKIIVDIFNSIKNSSNKKNVIIKFGKSFIKEFSSLMNRLETDKPFILFNLGEQNDDKDNLFKNFKNPQYISYSTINEKNDQKKYYSKIISYILEKSCYYNEFGNKYNKYFPDNLFYKEPKGFLYFNILLTGESRAGKSCFINRIFNKLVSFESSKFESSTLKINYYELYPKEEENPNSNLLKNGYGGIKIYDTPGLVKTDKLNSFELIREELSQIFDKIHIIYFFIKAQSNLEQCINMLQYINEINKKRKKNNINKIPILFIKNGEDLTISQEKPIIFQELKKELKKYNLMELYDNSININNKEKTYNNDNFFDEEEENGKKYENYIEGNIIQIHIPTGKNIDRIFSTTKEYLIKNNDSLIKKIFHQIKMKQNY